VWGVDQNSLDVVYTDQTHVNGSWSGWNNFGHLSEIDACYAVRVDDWDFRSGYARLLSPNQGVGCDKDGRLEIFGASGRQLWHKWQLNLANQSQWSQWGGLGSPAPIIENLGDWTAIQNQDGRIEAFAVATDPRSGSLELWHIWQTEPNGNWSPWDELGELPIAYLHSNLEFNTLKGAFRAARSADGRIMIFAVDNQYSLFIECKRSRTDRGKTDGSHWAART
jgi:hypothetical protein